VDSPFFTWTATTAPAAIADECFRRDPLAYGDGIYQSAVAAVAADPREIYTSADIDRLAAAVLAKPITFGADKPAVSAAAITATTAKAAPVDAYLATIDHPDPGRRATITIRPLTAK
jgi:hypothetical protein